MKLLEALEVLRQMPAEGAPTLNVALACGFTRPHLQMQSYSRFVPSAHPLECFPQIFIPDDSPLDEHVIAPEHLIH